MKLPQPDKIAVDHSHELQKRLRETILTSGPISFAQFMHEALYAPGLGYYSAGAHKFGPGGDFITAPDISPLFAECIARQCQSILSTLSGGDILELGAGSGKFASDLLTALKNLHSLPKQYYILEVSADLRERQQVFLKKMLPDFFEKIIWLDTLPQKPICGIIFANEVIDAMPVHCFQLKNNVVFERCVTWHDNHFAWHLATPTTNTLIAAVDVIQKDFLLPENYISEINLQLPAWLKSLENTLEKGIILLFDYGYSRKEYYREDRNTGTLRCFYQHHVHDDPFFYPGLQDITAHVDFTYVAESATAANLTVSGYTTQAAFLLNCGLLELAQTKSLTDAAYFQQAQALKTLLLPTEMGELVKVIGLTKQWDAPLLGFTDIDKKREL